MLLLCGVLAVSSLLVWSAQSKTRAALSQSQQHASQVEDLLYISDIQLAYQAWDRQDIVQVNEILDRQRRSRDDVDRRGVEWHLLKTLAMEPKGTTLGSHGESANELAVFPDRQRVASVGDDGMLQIWRIDSGENLRSINTGEKALHSVAISPDGSTVATGSTEVQLWNVAAGTREMLLTEHEANVEAIAFSPDGDRIVTASRYDLLRLFSRTGELLREVEDSGRHESMEFVQDGTRLLIPSRIDNDRREGIIRLWRSDLSAVERDFTPDLERGISNYTLASASPDGSYYAFSERYNRHHTRLLDTRTHQELALPPYRDQINTTAISPGGQIIAAGYSNGVVNYWKVERTSLGEFLAPERTYSFRAHRGRVLSMRFAGEDRLVTCGGDGQVKSWSLGIGRNPQVIGSMVLSMAVSPNNQRIALSCIDSLQLMNAEGDSLARYQPENAHITSAAFSFDGMLLANPCLNREIVELRDGHTGALLHQFSLGSNADAVSFSPTRRELAAVLASGEVCLLDPQEKTQIARINMGDQGNLHACQYSPDGRFLVCAGGMEFIATIDADSHVVVQRVPVESQANCLAFDPAGSVLASGHEDGFIRLWEWPTGNLRAILTGHEAAVLSLSFSPDGRTIASTSFDLTRRLWSVEFERECGVLYRGVRSGRRIVFSPDGKTLYAGYGGHAGGLAVFGISRW